MERDGAFMETKRGGDEERAHWWSLRNGIGLMMVVGFGERERGEFFFLKTRTAPKLLQK